MGRLWVPRTGWCNAPSACRVSRDGACDERVQDRSNLYMRPCPASSCPNIALVELRRNGVVTGRTSAHDLFDDRPNVGGKPPRIGAGSLRTSFRSLAQVGIA